MKKVIALLLSVIMLFGALSTSAFAAVDIDELYNNTENKYSLTNEQVVLRFDLNSGRISGGVNVLESMDAPKFEYVMNYSGEFYDMIPDNSKDPTKSKQTPGTEVMLPGVIPPSDYKFNGWYCKYTGATYPANYVFEIPENSPTVLEFMADFSLVAPEEDTMAGVTNILVKVFGTIIGLLFYSNEYGPSATEYGMKIMSDLLGLLLS